MFSKYLCFVENFQINLLIFRWKMTNTKKKINIKNKNNNNNAENLI